MALAGMTSGHCWPSVPARVMIDDRWSRPLTTLDAAACWLAVLAASAKMIDAPTAFVAFC